LTLVAGLLLPFGTIPAAEAKKRAATPAALALPVTGTVAGGGTFAGTLHLQQFAARAGQVVGVGLVSGVLDAGGIRRTVLHGPVELPVTVAGGAAGAPAIRDQRGTDRWLDRPVISYVQQESCGILDLSLLGSDLNVLGLVVDLDIIALDLTGDTAGPLGNLVCQALELVNNVAGLVGVLNELLGVLGGLTA
jgi:hypothetical protein